MAITFPLDVPLTELTEFTVDHHDANRFVTAGFTGKGVVQQFDADYWKARLRYRNIPREFAQEVLAFGNALRGGLGTFVLPFPGYSQPLGEAKDNPSSPTVSGSGQAGNAELLVTSAPISLENWLLAGDIIQVGPANRPHWHRVLANVDTDGSGNATIDVWPRVREGTVNTDQVSLSTPLSIFRLTEVFSVDIVTPVLHTIEFNCREAI